ncbi:hypothetical protein Srot_0451 [Segniliparus rotundus DSM 44985]|uniref:Uncharacterized protein n=1 Tax=Segniliparus rotundus (strain ATCC BAA-972 / CDC 1076 / CIP 108378 / DSM 44985 / JCM 13578) TaxID=640132 RepID=D6ZBW1_SEGRD|nr:hypothetical protein [Segniliparus rotundus]ADG96938.1 hypothetical protein Srot_0451 [Segniliparus rotundus DSM 44985]
MLVVAIAVLGHRMWFPSAEPRTSNRDFEQAKANVIRVTAWVAGVARDAEGRGSKQGCRAGTLGEGPPWLWSQEYDLPYSEQTAHDLTARLRQLRDEGWSYVETKPELEQVHTKLGVQVSNSEQVSIDAWRSSKVNIEDDAKAGVAPQQHTMSIIGLSECTN